ncbi:MAG: peptidoglycan-associated lipoprotein Pal [Kiloniellales bacterium]
MRFKFLALVAAAALLLAGCESASQGESSTTGTGATSGTTSPSTSGSSNTGVSSVPGTGPGSQEDLTVKVGDRVFFDYDQSDLTGDARGTVERLAVWLNTYPAVTLVVEGHCDERGTREYNLALGERRANSVRDYLIALGIDGNRVSTISYGKERPAVLGSNEQAWAQNRRGVFVVS